MPFQLEHLSSNPEVCGRAEERFSQFLKTQTTINSFVFGGGFDNQCNRSVISTLNNISSLCLYTHYLTRELLLYKKLGRLESVQNVVLEGIVYTNDFPYFQTFIQCVPDVIELRTILKHFTF